jgi:ABC-type enterochelin transport system ATPase subunit
VERRGSIETKCFVCMFVCMYVKFIYIAHLSCKHATNDADKIASVVRHLCRQFVKDVVLILHTF